MGFLWARKRTRKHVCTMGFGSDSMLPKEDGKKDKLHTIKKSLQIAVIHPKTLKFFPSYPSIAAERQRQIILCGYWVIHPYSIFNLVWCTFMILINVLFIIMAPYRFSYVIPHTPARFTKMDYVLPFLKTVVFLDILVKMDTGYRSRKETFIILERRRIIVNYLLRWGAIDMISCLPAESIIRHIQPSYKVQMFLRLLPCIRCVRLYTVLKDFKILVQLLRIKYMCGRCLRHGLLFVVSLHLCSCLVYVPHILDTYWGGQLTKSYSSLKLLTTTASKRYEAALFITCTGFFGKGFRRRLATIRDYEDLDLTVIFISLKKGTTFSTFRSEVPGEIIVNAIIVLYGQLLVVYTMVLLMKMYFVCYDSTMKYQELMDQVEKYMRHKEFPSQMVQRVRDFYNYRYQRRYFKERFVLDCLSEQLRNEIFLDTCHKLIDKVRLFEGLPASIVGTVLGCLKPEVYMRNDLVIKAGDSGDCMYFIANGTVAVLSLKGAEVCHLDDGAHFGEIALLMKDRKRVATVVAIEVTQVYRLDSQDFRDFIITYHELYERIQELAAKRMHETVLIDEEFKQKKQQIK